MWRVYYETPDCFCRANAGKQYIGFGNRLMISVSKSKKQTPAADRHTGAGFRYFG